MLAMPRRSTGLRRRGKNWHGRWVENGREREKSFGPNLAIARRCLDETRRNARLRAVGMGAELAQVAALAPLVEAYLAAKAPRWKPEYLRVVKAALAEMLDGIDRVADLTAGRVETARDRMPGSNRTKNKKAGLGPWLRALAPAVGPREPSPPRASACSHGRTASSGGPCPGTR